MKVKIKPISLVLIVISCVLLIGMRPQPSNAQDKSSGRSGKEVFTGNVIFFDGTFGPGFGRGSRGTNVDTFTLTVQSYTPDNEVQSMLSALQSDKQDGLLRLLRKEKRGTIQIGTRLGRDVQAVWMTQTEEGRKVYALSERWMGFGELRRGARSTDYPFTYLEIYVEEDNKGEGSLIPAARVRSKGGNNIEVENFGIYPARLTNVKLVRK
jgi:hypothetical protein